VIRRTNHFCSLAEGKIAAIKQLLMFIHKWALLSSSYKRTKFRLRNFRFLYKTYV